MTAAFKASNEKCKSEAKRLTESEPFSDAPSDSAAMFHT